MCPPTPDPLAFRRSGGVGRTGSRTGPVTSPTTQICCYFRRQRCCPSSQASSPGRSLGNGSPWDSFSDPGRNLSIIGLINGPIYPLHQLQRPEPPPGATAAGCSPQILPPPQGCPLDAQLDGFVARAIIGADEVARQGGTTCFGYPRGLIGWSFLTAGPTEKVASAPN